ncbi:MAG: hypothetical protein IJU48_10015 [Synergistaceae bacterium]|nr:hypothetical protein [Synergistaceae bacterium]
MLKRTPGKWTWNFSFTPENYGKPGIFVEGEGKPLTPMIGALQLMAYAPEMHEMLCEVIDELDEALTQGVITAGIHKIARKIVTLLEEIKVERQDTDKEARR